MEEFWQRLYKQLIFDGFNYYDKGKLIKYEAGNIYIINLNLEIDNNQLDFDASKIYIINIIAYYEPLEQNLRLLEKEIDIDKKIVNINWGVDLKNKELVIFKNQPKKFLNIERYIIKAMCGEEITTDIRSIRILKKPYITYTLISSLILIYFIVNIFLSDYMKDIFFKFGISPDIMENRQYYRFFTYMFLHANINHILNNCLSLYIFGSIIERYMGRLAFSSIYFLGGIFAGIFSLIFNKGYSVGASGAIFALISASMYFSNKEKINPNGINFYVMFIITIINIISGFVSQGIDNAGHIGGFLAGFIIVKIFYLKRV